MVSLCKKYWNPDRDKRIAKPRRRKEVIPSAVCLDKEGNYYTSGVRVNKDGLTGRNHIQGVRLRKNDKGAWVEQ
jgi:hypothetical protein